MAKVRKQTPRRKATKTSRERTGLLSNVEEIDFDDEGIKICVYGRSATGKTTLWASFPKPILAVVCSGGKRSGELRSIRNIKGIQKYELTDTEQIGQLCKEIEESGEYATIVLDHISYLQDMTMKELLDLEEIPAQKSWGLASQQQYGQCALKMKEFLRHFIGLTANVVLVAQEREFNVDNESDILLPYVGAALTPSVTGWLNPAVDYVVQTFKMREKKVIKRKVGKKVITKEVDTGKTGYYLRTGPDPVFTTKFRVPKEYALPDYILDPTYDKIMEVINGEYHASPE